MDLTGQTERLEDALQQIGHDLEALLTGPSARKLHAAELGCIRDQVLHTSAEALFRANKSYSSPTLRNVARVGRWMTAGVWLSDGAAHARHEHSPATQQHADDAVWGRLEAAAGTSYSRPRPFILVISILSPPYLKPPVMRQLQVIFLQSSLPALASSSPHCVGIFIDTLRWHLLRWHLPCHQCLRSLSLAANICAASISVPFHRCDRDSNVIDVKGQRS